MSENVFVGVDSFRRLLLGAAGGYELQGHHEAAETGHRAGKITPEEGWLEELAAAARRAGVPLWIKDSEEIRAVIGGEPAQALPDALKHPKDRPTPHCAECEHCIKTQEGQRGTRKDCAIGWAAEGYEDGGARHIPTRGNRQSPDWCPRRKDDAE